MISARMDFTTLKGRLEDVNLAVVLQLALATLLVIVKVDHVLAMRIMLASNVDPVQGGTMIIQAVMVTLVSYYVSGNIGNII